MALSALPLPKEAPAEAWAFLGHGQPTLGGKSTVPKPPTQGFGSFHHRGDAGEGSGLCGLPLSPPFPALTTGGLPDALARTLVPTLDRNQVGMAASSETESSSGRALAFDGSHTQPHIISHTRACSSWLAAPVPGPYLPVYFTHTAKLCA